MSLIPLLTKTRFLLGKGGEDFNFSALKSSILKARAFVLQSKKVRKGYKCFLFFLLYKKKCPNCFF